MNKPIIILMVLFLTASSCSLFKKQSHRKPTATVTNSVFRVDSSQSVSIEGLGYLSPSDSLTKALVSIWQRPIDFITLSLKAKVHYEGQEQKQDFAAAIRLRKDSALWIAVNALGGIVQVARIYITPDSLFLINYLEKKASRMSLSNAGNMLPFPGDFTLFQNLIIGGPLSRKGIAVESSPTEQLLSLRILDGHSFQQLNYTRRDTTLQSITMFATDGSELSAHLQFAGQQLIGPLNFATQRVWDVTNEGVPHHLSIEFSKVEVNQPVSFPFSIPGNYNKDW